MNISISDIQVSISVLNHTTAIKFLGALFVLHCASSVVPIKTSYQNSDDGKGTKFSALHGKHHRLYEGVAELLGAG
jgi:hypothetical protein